jgi:hypothetical protein
MVHPRALLLQTTVQALRNPKAHFLVAQEEGDSMLLGFVRYQIETPKDGPQELSANDDVDEDTSSQISLFSPKDHLKEVWESLQNTEASIKECYESASKGQKHACKRNNSRQHYLANRHTLLILKWKTFTT